ncbi:MAG: methyltransferase domain-containing protein, partial [Actinomycetota bacterium]
RMDATELDFANESFDNIICLEAAFHFQTRDKFYREALRVLKPGGLLVTSDILGPEIIWPGNSVDGGPKGLKERLEQAGFTDTQVWDRTLECRDGFKRNIRRWPRQELKAKRISPARYLHLIMYAGLRAVVGTYITTHYVITSAQKPAIPGASPSASDTEDKAASS